MVMKTQQTMKMKRKIWKPGQHIESHDGLSRKSRTAGLGRWRGRDYFSLAICMLEFFCVFSIRNETTRNWNYKGSHCAVPIIIIDISWRKGIIVPAKVILKDLFLQIGKVWIKYMKYCNIWHCKQKYLIRSGWSFSMPSSRIVTDTPKPGVVKTKSKGSGVNRSTYLSHRSHLHQQQNC